MADKKEYIKKTLGISEYPWSSDEDDNDCPQPSITSANVNRPFANVIQWPTTSATTSQPTTSTPTTNAPSVSSAATAAAASSARARMDRNMFWSLVCHPNTTQVDIVQRQANRAEAMSRHREMVHPGSVSRRPDTLLRRTSPLREIRGILAIKKATRQITSARNLSYPSFYTGQPRGPQISWRKSSLFTRRPYENIAHPFFPSSSSSRDAEEPQPSTSGARRPPRPPPPPPEVVDPAPEPRPSDDDPIDLDASNEDCRILDQEPEDRSDGNQAESSYETPNVSAEITLEEEVLEVEPAQEATEARIVENENETGDVQAAPNETSTAEAKDESRIVKRKRDCSVSATDTSKEESVKELNQCLLRLLECPVCLEWMEPPMSQCRRGHLVCVKCRARLSSCPVCRTTFSSVRNRAMEGVAQMLRYPCRHGCTREVSLRRRASHEANCEHRRYACPAAPCAERPPLPHKELTHHFQSKHLSMVKYGRKQKFAVKVNAELHENWFILALHEIFHLRIDVDIRTWGVTVFVAFVGPKNASRKYTYEVTVVGKHNARRLVYTRATHSDLESTAQPVCRQDCFHLSLDQALNFLRIKNRHCESDNSLYMSVAIMKNETEAEREDSCDS